ncbi:MAG: hypothetical protein Kow00108_22210 [Calditrichia bacterium]
MNLSITARRFKLSDDLRDYIEEKMQKLTRYHENIINAEVILGWEKQSRFVEVILDVSQDKIVVTEKTEDLRKSFDLALDRAERQLKKYKTKFQDKRKEKPVVNL